MNQNNKTSFFNTLFIRIITIFLFVVILISALYFYLIYHNFKNVIINNQMNYIASSARELSFILTKVYKNNLINYDNNDLDSLLIFKTNELKRRYNANIYFFNSKKELIKSYETYTNKYNVIKNKLKENIDIVLSGNEVRSYIAIKNDNIIFLGIPFRYKSGIQGSLFICTNSSNINIESNNITEMIIAITLIAISVFGIISTLFAKKLVVPLEKINLATVELSKGNYSLRVDACGTDETIRLANSFNNMAEKLEKNDIAKRNFISNASHELKSPITSIYGYITAIIDKTVPEKKIEFYLNIILEESKRLSNLINDLLNLSRLESKNQELNISKFDINECIDKVVKTKYKFIQDNSINLNREYQNEKEFVYADQSKIEQIIVNLIDNSLKFCEKNGNISFYTKSIKNKVVIDVIDDGIGVAKEEIENIFDRFYKLDKSRSQTKGTGLGLAICREIINLHGEKIYAIYKENGCHIRFTLSNKNIKEKI